ncbi:MAG: GH116 family glycosyl-hydrolase [Candidatus Edwardsbacteria bacterium]
MDRRPYTNQALRALAMPMGGIGAGQVSIAGDGGLRQWQIVNLPNHIAHIPMSFFAVWTKSGDFSVAKLLQSDAMYDNTKFSPAPLVTDHIIPEESKKLLKLLPGIKEIEFVGEYPIAEVRYKDDELPIEITLKAFSPFVPLDSKDSALPAIVFNFIVKSNKHVSFSILASLQNAVGWDGKSEICGVECPLYGGNFNKIVRLKGFTGINMRNGGEGSMTLGALDKTSFYLTQWDDLNTVWEYFIKEGTLPNINSSIPSEKGRTWNGAIAVKKEIAPSELANVIFIISWYFPNRYVNWSQKYFGVSDDKFFLGNMYSNWFKSSLDVGTYVKRKYKRLNELTELFRQVFYDSILPYEVLDCISSNISTIRSPTIMWTKDGNIFGFEGCCGASTENKLGGCCPLNCTHVWNYEQSLSKLFPDLERTMRDVDLNINMSEDGAIPHRTVLPFHLPRWSSDAQDSEVYAADGHCGTILKTYRECRQAGGKALLDKVWLKIKLAMAYAQRRWDSNCDGVFDGPQWNTYDCNLYGKNSFVSGLYLAALRATEEMAKLQGEYSLANEYKERFESGRDIIDKELWNGEYYIQRYDANKYVKDQYGNGCHLDQLLGQWWANQLDLGYILPKEHVREALKSIYRYNFRKNFVGFKQKPRQFACEDEPGLIICSWPRGGRPETPTLYSDEIWTGIEYAVATLMIQEGLVDEGLSIVFAARSRYDGRRRNPWNEIECGDHYVRAMSSWGLLEALSGYCYNVLDGLIGFAPKLNPENFRCFFITKDGWGTFSQNINENEQIDTIKVAYGKVEIKTLRFFTKREPKTVMVEEPKGRIKARFVKNAFWLYIKLEHLVHLVEGKAIQVKFIV